MKWLLFICHWAQNSNSVFSRTFQRFSTGLMCGLCRCQSMCTSYVSCHLNHSLSPMNPGIVILEYTHAFTEETNPLMEKPCLSVYSRSQLNSFFGHMMFLNLDLTNWIQPKIIMLPRQARMAGTKHDGCINSSASLLTLMCPSLWNRVNLNSSDHQTFFHSIRVQSLCSLPNWSLFFSS